MTAPKYKAGYRYHTLEEMYHEKIVYVPKWKSARSIGFFYSWHWRIVRNAVLSGFIVRAVKIDENGLIRKTIRKEE